MQTLFSEIENLLDDSIPSDIKQILEGCAFDTELSLLAISDEIIMDIEDHVNSEREILKNTSYENVHSFKFKPGHKIFLLQLPNQIKILREAKAKNPQRECLPPRMSNFSYILKTFIETADANLSKHPKGHRYCEANRNFSIYIYLLCGRACYETLSANLPIPSSNAIRKIISQCKN